MLFWSGTKDSQEENIQVGKFTLGSDYSQGNFSSVLRKVTPENLPAAFTV